jgi:hypothetical protein
LSNLRQSLSPYSFARETAVVFRNSGIILAISFILTGNQAFAQGNSGALAPSEAYKTALAPLTKARAQSGDLTDADKFALGIGIARASRECLSMDTSAFATNSKELLALGELCLFGRQYEPARVALTKYLVFPEQKERKRALLLLVRAHLGLGQPGSAVAEVVLLLRDFPYDAQIHFAIDQVIDAAEGVDAQFNHLALNLCTKQNAITLPLLVDGKALDGNDINASSNVLFSDATRCAALAEEFNKPGTQGTMHQLAAIVEQPNWVGTADLAPMQGTWKRQKMVGTKAPLSALHGHILSSSKLVPRTVSLMSGTVLLLPFTLWSPSTPDAAHDLSKFAPQQTIYAITSWQANTGRDDVLSSQILRALRLWQRAFPPHVYILIVPDSELSTFHSDAFPGGIVIRDGIVQSNGILSSPGAERMLFRTLTDGVERR